MKMFVSRNWGTQDDEGQSQGVSIKQHPMDGGGQKTIHSGTVRWATST
jgi:hypothetical protein